MTHTRRGRYRRRRRIRQALIILILAGAGMIILLAGGWHRRMTVEGVSDATPTPTAAAYDRTATTREICLQETVWYTIQTGVFSQKEAALEKADAYKERGAPGTVVEDGGKWRVFIASYGREEDAAAVRQRLGEQQRVETYQYAWTCPELRLRLSGMAGQLDAAEAGLMLFAGAGAILRDTATLLDAGQLTTQEALAAARELDGQIKLWMQTAHERFGTRPPELVVSLLERGSGWTDRMAKLQEAAESPVTLSAGLKAQGMALYDEEIRMRREINGP